jgi:hypothetical protein
MHPSLRLFVLAVVLTALPYRAFGQQKNVGFLAEQLRTATDFRVRTQAALALGSSGSSEAVAPLCDGLDDSSEAVRGAAAAALGKLGKSEAVPCLTKHAKETSGSVRAMIERALGSLQGKPAKPPPPGANDTFYVAIGPVTDKSGRKDNSVISLVLAAMQQKLLSMRGYAVAPQSETVAAARKVIQKNSLTGYFLQTRVELPKMSGSDLTVQIRVTLWSYPSKSLQGEFSPKLTMSGVSAGDTDSEDELIKMAVEKALDNFARVAAASN